MSRPFLNSSAVLRCACPRFADSESVIRESDNEVRFESVSVGSWDVVTADAEVRMVHLGSGTQMTSFVKTKEPQMKDHVHCGWSERLRCNG